MNKKFRKIVAGLLSAAMAVPMTAGLTVPMSVSAYEVLGESTFDHKILPWHTVEAAPAKQYFVLEDGAVHITIMEPIGADYEKWDLQFRHRNLDFKKGHVYKVSCKVKSNRDGMELDSYIGNIRGDEEYFVLDGASEDDKMHMGPHMGGQWSMAPVRLTTEYQEFSGTFIPTKDIEAAEWTFQYARGSKYYGNAERGDELWFDDMSIEDTSDDSYIPPVNNYGYTSRSCSGLENNYISVNQLGYYPGRAKFATLGDNQGDVLNDADTIKLSGSDEYDIVRGSYEYEIVNTADDKVVYTGTTERAKKDNDSGDTVCKIDFTEFNEPGEYYIRIKDKEWRSFPFKIGNDIYSDSQNNMLTNALNYFYQNRSYTKIEEKFITSGEPNELAHNYNHDEASGFVLPHWCNKYKLNSAKDVVENGSSKINTSGGWFNGADYDKSMTEGGISVWMLQNMYERATFTKSGVKKFADNSGTVVIPETGNDYPDILDECRYELDYMSKMKVPEDEETWGKYAGLYYHSAQGVNFKPVNLDYEHENECVYAVQPPSFAATLNYAACAAQGARLWAEYDAEYAKELMESAKAAYQAYLDNYYKAASDEYYNPESQYASLYNLDDGDLEVSDDAYWAACELFISANKLDDENADFYYKELSGYKDAFEFQSRVTGGNNDDYSLTFFNNGNTAAAGSMSLLLNSNFLDCDKCTVLETSLIEAAACYIETENDQGYGIPYLYDGPGANYDDGIFYVYGYGFESASNERVLSNLLAMAYAYDMTGNDKYINGVATGLDYLFGNNPLSYSYITGYGSYHVQNPMHKYWQHEADKTLPKAPDGVIVSGPSVQGMDQYMQALGFVKDDAEASSERYYADSIESVGSNESSLSCNAALAWIVSFMQDEAPTEIVATDVNGDINADGKLNMTDAVLLQKWLLGNTATKLSNAEACDFCKDGVLDVFDLIAMKKAIIKSSN